MVWKGRRLGCWRGPLRSFRSDAGQLFDVCRQLRGAEAPAEWISHDPGLLDTSMAVAPMGVETSALLRIAELCDSVVPVVTNLEKAGSICGVTNSLDPGRGEPGGKQVRLFHLATGQVSRKQVMVWLHSRQKSQSRAVCTGGLPKRAWVEKEREKERKYTYSLRLHFSTVNGHRGAHSVRLPSRKRSVLIHHLTYGLYLSQK